MMVVLPTAMAINAVIFAGRTHKHMHHRQDINTYDCASICSLRRGYLEFDRRALFSCSEVRRCRGFPEPEGNHVGQGRGYVLVQVARGAPFNPCIVMSTVSSFSSNREMVSDDRKGIVTWDLEVHEESRISQTEGSQTTSKRPTKKPGDGKDYKDI